MLAQPRRPPHPCGMIRAFLLSLAQLGDRAILGVLAKSLAVTLALFALLGVGVWWGTDAALAAWAWHGSAAAVVAAAVTVLALWLLFRAIAVLVVGLFADEVVQAVEARHYPAALASARPVAFHRALGMGLRSALRFVLVNLLALPLYLVLLATGVGTAVLFFAVNAWLLGRDLGDMVAARHLTGAMMRQWRAATGGKRFLLGLAATGLFVVPVVNLVAPVLGAAMATHLFHRGRK
jgi:CysZ protein